MTHHIGWSEERVALLRKLWAEGLSGGQIAKQLGACAAHMPARPDDSGGGEKLALAMNGGPL